MKNISQKAIVPALLIALFVCGVSFVAGCTSGGGGSSSGGGSSVSGGGGSSSGGAKIRRGDPSDPNDKGGRDNNKSKDNDND